LTSYDKLQAYSQSQFDDDDKLKAYGFKEDLLTNSQTLQDLIVDSDRGYWIIVLTYDSVYPGLFNVTAQTRSPIFNEFQKDMVEKGTRFEVIGRSSLLKRDYLRRFKMYLETGNPFLSGLSDEDQTAVRAMYDMLGNSGMGAVEKDIQEEAGPAMDEEEYGHVMEEEEEAPSKMKEPKGHKRSKSMAKMEESGY
jgi:hypothetical protein